jgi:signal peptide peptidase SppA
MKRYPHVLQAVYGRPWLIDRDFFEEILAPIADLRAAGLSFSPEEIEARLQAARDQDGQGERRERILASAAGYNDGRAPKGGAPYVIPIFGPISRRMNMMTMSGGTSIEDLAAEFRAALADDGVCGIVFAIDSPGGSVDGVEEFAAEIRAARDQKPIVAVADASALSAAYYIASAAQELVVTPSGRVGSVGVIYQHTDSTKADEMAGLQKTRIFAGKYKTETMQPLTEEATAAIQADVDEYYRMFVRAVARGRGVSMETVRADYGQGRAVLAKAALAAGMVDRIDTLDNTIRRVGRGAIKPAGLGPDTTDDASAAAASAPSGELDPEAVAAEGEQVLVMAQKHAAARATEGRSLSAADRERLVAQRGAIDELLLKPAKAEESPARARTVIDLVQAMAERGYPIPPREGATR